MPNEIKIVIIKKEFQQSFKKFNINFKFLLDQPYFIIIIIGNLFFCQFFCKNQTPLIAFCKLYVLTQITLKVLNLNEQKYSFQLQSILTYVGRMLYLCWRRNITVHFHHLYYGHLSYYKLNVINTDIDNWFAFYWCYIVVS